MEKLGCILLVDDNFNDNLYHTTVLKQGETVREIKTVTNGAQALMYLENSKQDAGKFPFPDLIFLDIRMPVMDGFTFLKELKQNITGLPRQPVIVLMTGSLDMENEKTAYETFSGEINVFVNKPLTPVLVNSIIAKFF